MEPRYRIQKWVSALRKWASYGKFKEEYDRELLREYHLWLKKTGWLKGGCPRYICVDEFMIFLKERTP